MQRKITKEKSVFCVARSIRQSAAPTACKAICCEIFPLRTICIVLEKTGSVADHPPSVRPLVTIQRVLLALFYVIKSVLLIGFS